MSTRALYYSEGDNKCSDNKQAMDEMDENLKHYFEKLYDEFGPAVMNITYSVLNDEELAKDAFQEAFLSIAQNIERINRDPEKTKRFIKKVAKNAAVTIYRKYKVIRKNELPLPDDENKKDDGNGTVCRSAAFRTESFEEELIKKEDKKNLISSLNELDDNNFEFVYEYYYEDMNYEAIAEKHGLSKEAAKKRVYRSVDKLKKIFERKKKIK